VRALITLALVLCLSLLGEPASAQRYYWIETDFGSPEISYADVDGGGPTVHVALEPGSLPEGAAFDPVARQIYWCEANYTNARILRAERDLSGIQVIVSGGSVFRGLAIDLAGRHLYWTSSNQLIGGNIFRSDLDGNNAGEILNLRGVPQNPRGIALYPGAGKLYWADFGADAILRADLDGGNVETVRNLEVGSGAYGIALDVAHNHLYWSEYNSGQILRSDLDGQNGEKVVTELVNPTYIALDLQNDIIAWTEADPAGQRVAIALVADGDPLALPGPYSTFGGVAIGPTGTVVDVPVPREGVSEFALSPISPNPVIGPATIRYAVPRPAHVRIQVFNAQGREVARLFDGTQQAGRHQVDWAGSGLGAGIYFVRLQAPAFERVERVVLLD
jgi:DNA-binding beta-propeller fold protein YncE